MALFCLWGVICTFSSSLRLAVKLLASDRRRAHSVGGGGCLEGGGASASDGFEWGSALRKASTWQKEEQLSY